MHEGLGGLGGLMIKRYKVAKHNSTVCGYPGRDFDWSKFCWDGSETHKSIFRGVKNMQAPKPFVDDCFIVENCQYLHVPFDFTEHGTIYRVRPNPSMYAGETYMGHKVLTQKAVLESGVWYWELEVL